MKFFLLFFLIFPYLIYPQSGKTKNHKDSIVHYISDDDTYHSIKLKYGISKRKIIKWNPELKGCKFLIDCLEISTIKIFINEKNTFIDFSLEDTLTNKNYFEKNETNLNLDSLKLFNELSIDSLIFQQTDSIINIAILLPFLSNTIDSVITNTPSKFFNHTKFLKESRISFDFYSGLLFSFHEFFNTSDLQLRLNVFDTHHNIDSVKNILARNNLDSMDLIFGPLYQENFELLDNLIINPNTIIISPLQSSSVNKNYLSNNVYFFESESNNKISFTSNYIFNKFVKPSNSSHTISIFLKEDEENKKKLVSNYLKSWRDNIYYYEINKSTISEQMLDEEINSISDIVYIPSSDPVFVSDIISRLHALKDTSIVVFCNDDILNFNLIPHSDLFDLNVHFFSEKKPFYESISFIKSFYQYFSINPQNSYVHQGYKCGLYFLNIFYGNYVSSNENSVLGTYYKFLLQENKIYRNEALKLWKYQRYDIKEVLDFTENQ